METVRVYVALASPFQNTWPGVTQVPLPVVSVWLNPLFVSCTVAPFIASPVVASFTVTSRARVMCGTATSCKVAVVFGAKEKEGRGVVPAKSYEAEVRRAEYVSHSIFDSAYVPEELVVKLVVGYFNTPVPINFVPVKENPIVGRATQEAFTVPTLSVLTLSMAKLTEVTCFATTVESGLTGVAPAAPPGGYVWSVEYPVFVAVIL